MENDTEKLRTELKELVSNCKDEALLEEMLKMARKYNE